VFFFYGVGQDRFLAFPEAQRPVVLQLGGTTPSLLGRPWPHSSRYHYDEINIEVRTPWMDPLFFRVLLARVLALQEWRPH